MTDTFSVSPALSTSHPLEPLSAEEIIAAVSIVRSKRQLGPLVRFVSVTLHEPAPEVALNYKPGDPVTVLGYPGISPDVVGVIQSKEEFYRNPQYRIIPDPTVSQGVIGRVLRGQSADNRESTFISTIGDYYQLSVNSTGAGNSGGPVFDNEGHVIAIFSDEVVGGRITFAVPIRFGQELMRVSPTNK